ncbi:MAG: ADP-forming succinate--CoA ligase subunit beta [Opitutales bacterium]|jgi:succinyl-CoA synthetase beta subunit|nr:ADP-forming succinate--CoA ligase subunit beta [Pseudobdellovibrionaceae bacterium]
MNIHEYQAKKLFADAGVAVPNGTVAQNEQEFDQALSHLPAGQAIVVKAQIHAGGRGKGTFKDGYKGGVHVVSSADEALEKAKAMLGNVLVTKQTGEEGKEVRTVYFNEATDIEKEYYLAVLMDRATSKPVIIASTEGGMDIEEVAESSPEKILKVLVDPTLGLRPYQARQIAFGLELSGDSFKQCVKLVTRLYDFFWSKDCSQVEVNPLVTTPTGDVLALDAKVNFDANALFRHPDVVELRDLTEEDPKEVEASKFDLNYIALDGNVACMVNGAGLAMATMDIIKHYGGSPANFLDVGGGATEEQVENAFRILVSDDAVKAILVNIFGGIMKCDVIATGIVNAARKLEMKVPLVVRLEGTNVEEGKQILADSGLTLEPADSLAEAAEKIVQLAAQA